MHINFYQHPNMQMDGMGGSGCKTQNWSINNSLSRVWMCINAPNQKANLEPTSSVPLISGCAKPVTLSMSLNWEIMDCKNYWGQYVENHDNLLTSFACFWHRFNYTIRSFFWNPCKIPHKIELFNYWSARKWGWIQSLKLNSVSWLVVHISFVFDALRSVRVESCST